MSDIICMYTTVQVIYSVKLCLVAATNVIFQLVINCDVL